MSLRIQINHKLLSDSPFCESNKNLFAPPHPATDGLIQDIRNGTPTCYLISGYRGAGKSSFIKRLEQKIKGEVEDKKETAIKNPEEVVFVHVNFSRYGSQTFLLRKLIRGLYLEIKDKKSFKEIKLGEADKSFEEKTAHLLEDLYEKTFYDTSYNVLKSAKKETVMVFNIDVISLVKFLLPTLLFILFVLNSIFNLIPSHFLINILGTLSSLFFGIKGVIDITHKISNSKIEQKDFIRKSMYDNEIADHHFYLILKELQAKKYKIVFVLDELDKVEDDDLDKLLKEMKPYLVSGTASFIAVAGQNLFYKYSQSKSIDDNVLSSIFSKFIHIPLFSRMDMHDLFDRLITDKSKLTEDEKSFLNKYVDSLIFESKKVPRKFVSLIRQNLVWEENTSFLEIDKEENELQIFSQILDAIDRVDDEEISTDGFDEALRDYFIMQLFIGAHKVLFSKKLIFTQSEILGQNGE